MDNISPEDNVYDGSPSYITWAGIDGATQFTNHTYCSGFVTGLLKQAYGLEDDDFADWLGSPSPSPSQYHAAIMASSGFHRVTTVDAILPGDILAIRYPEGSSPSGHVAVIRSIAAFRSATMPVIHGTYQFEVTVADSSRSPHGVQDTRTSDADTGAGFGVMRLYTDSSLRIVGHTWSTSTGSEYRGKISYPIAIGRLR